VKRKSRYFLQVKMCYLPFFVFIHCYVSLHFYSINIMAIIIIIVQNIHNNNNNNNNNNNKTNHVSRVCDVVTIHVIGNVFFP
jgi:hypothetical protein